jgi:hypothetical protein
MEEPTERHAQPHTKYLAIPKGDPEPATNVLCQMCATGAMTGKSMNQQPALAKLFAPINAVTNGGLGVCLVANSSVMSVQAALCTHQATPRHFPSP